MTSSTTNDHSSMTTPVLWVASLLAGLALALGACGGPRECTACMCEDGCRACPCSGLAPEELVEDEDAGR